MSTELSAAAAGLGSPVAGPAAAEAGAARLSHSANLASTIDRLFVTAEMGFNGTGPASNGVLRARTVAPGPWESIDINYLHDQDPTAPANAVTLYSTAARNYVSAEFGWTGQDKGILHARRGSTEVGPWETFYLTRNTDGSVSFSVNDGTATYWVGIEEGWPGDTQYTLVAAAASIGPHEKFAMSTRAISGYSDYPLAWGGDPKYLPAKDSFANVWGFNRECVSFAAWKIYENNGGTGAPAGNEPPADWAAHSINVDADWGNAGNWAAYAQAHGVTVNGTPTAGSIAQWDAGGDGGQFTVGHVALVAGVFPDGSILLTQYNLREDGKYSTLSMPAGKGATDTSNGHGAFDVSWPDHFIHINGF
jgi:CHAP domain